MTRITGLLTGVGLGVAIFLLILGTNRNEQPTAVSGVEEVTTAADLSGVVTAIAEQVDVLPAEAIDSEETVAVVPESETAETESQRLLESGTPDPGQSLEAQLMTEAGDAETDGDGAGDSYLFWSPFRSQWAAQGFAARLTSATEVDVEVVNTGPGRYRVAFDYEDEKERRARIDRIETITGLKLE